MVMLTRGTKVVVASHNAGKVWEINQLLEPYGLAAISAAGLGLAEPDETEPTFAGNALLKARAAADGSGLPALADDSGLEVEVLRGSPGIYSARWAGPGKDFGFAMRKVGDEITARQGWEAQGPRANFISVLCLAWPDGAHEVFEGKVFGTLVWPPRGGNGFGYDPMFVADGETLTFGEMAPAEKYAISHRTRAFAKFKAACLEPLTDGPASGPNAVRDRAGLAAAAANISSRDELAAFIVNLRAHMAKQPGPAAIPDILQGLEAWAGQSTITNADEPRWRTFAKALLTATNND